jgi:hypothetical protein
MRCRKTQRARPASALASGAGWEGPAEGGHGGQPTSGRPASKMKRDTLRPPSGKSARPTSALSVTWSARQSGATTPHRPTSAASLFSRPGSAFSVASGLSRGAEEAEPDAGVRQIAQVSGQMWSGQLLSLMTSVNKWPISLSPKSVSRAVCAKACALVQAESAALFLVNDSAGELVLMAKHPQRPTNQRPLSAAFGAGNVKEGGEAGSRTRGGGGGMGREDDVRVKFGVGLLGLAAAESKVIMSSDVAAEDAYDPEADNLANRPGLEAAPDTLLCVPLADSEGTLIAMLLLAEKKGGACFCPEDHLMCSLLGLQATTVLRCCDLHLRALQAQSDPSSQAPSASAAPSQQDQEKTEGREGGLNKHLLDALGHLMVEMEEGEEEEEALVLKVTAKICTFTGARATVFLAGAEDDSDELWSILRRAGEEEAPIRVRIPITNDTTAGLCFTKGQVISVPNLQQDPRFKDASSSSNTPALEHDTSKKLSVLCLPIKATEERIGATKSEEMFATLGVVEVISAEPLPDNACAVLRDYVSMLGRVFERAERRRRATLVKSAVEELAMCGSRLQAGNTVKQALRRCLHAEAVEFVEVDKSRKMLVKTYLDAQGNSVTVKKCIEEAGLAGFVVRTAKVLNELDITRVRTMDGTQYHATSDFISDTDLAGVQHGGAHGRGKENTKSAVPLLMAPVCRPNGDALGVLYALQKTVVGNGGLRYFDQGDELGMTELAAEYGRALVRIEKVEADASVISDLETLFHCSPEMLSEYDLRRLTRIISRDVCRITNAQHCSTYMVDHDSHEVWTQVT